MTSNDEQHLIKEDMLIVPCHVQADNQDLLVGLNAQKIVGVVESDGITPLTKLNYPFIGLREHQLQAVPIIDLSSVFKQSSLEMAKKIEDDAADDLSAILEHNANYLVQNNANKKSKVVICQLYFLTVGLLVNAAFRIEPIKNHQILHIPPMFEQHPECMFNGLIRYRDRFMYLLDLERILDRLGLIPMTKTQENNSLTNTNALKNKKVLVVDDSKVFRNQIIKLLTSNEMICEEANDGQDGLDKFMAAPDKFDLIIIDLEMPRMNGLEMARRIRGSGTSIPFLFNSSISNSALIAEIQAEHGCYLIKFQPEEIIKEINHILG